MDPVEVLDVAPSDRPALEEVPAPEHRLLRPQPEQPPGEVQQASALVVPVPVQPGQLVVLAVGVVVALLRVPELVAGLPHRHPLTEDEGQQQVAHLPPPQRDDRRISRRTLDAAVPAVVLVVASALSCRLASLCFRLSLTRSARVNPSCAVMMLMLADGRRPSSA
jgi:hypothetical protein